MTSTPSLPTVLPALTPGLADTARPPQEIPAVLLRASCDLEVLIPARNEARRLPTTLANTVRYLEAQTYSSRVVVIDNSKLDRTSDLAAQVWYRRVPVHLTGCAQPGKGAAVRRGLLTSRARFIGYMDADMATPIDTLDIVLPLLESGWLSSHRLPSGRRRHNLQAAACSPERWRHGFPGGGEPNAAWHFRQSVRL